MRHFCASFLLVVVPWLAAPRMTAAVPVENRVASVRSLLLDTPALAHWLVQNSREVAAAYARVDQARADAGGSRLFINPTVDFSITDIPVGPENTTYPPQGFTNSAIYTTGLSQTFELGKRGPRIASAQLMLEAARLAYLDTLSQKMGEARLALGRVLYLKAKQAMLQERLASAREVLAIERTRLKQGFMSGIDFDRLMLDTMTVEARTARNQAELDASLQLCEAVVFAPCEMQGSQASDLQRAAPLPSPLPDLAAAVAHRPDILALDVVRQSALQDAKGARRRAIPDLTLRLGYMEDRLVAAGDQPHTLQMGLVMPLPVFNRGQYDSAKSRARAGELELAGETALRRGRSEAEVLLRRQAYLSSTLERLVKTAVPRSDAVVKSALKAFNGGQISTTDLLAVRRSHLALLISERDLEFECFAVRNDLRRALALDVETAQQQGAVHR